MSTRAGPALTSHACFIPCVVSFMHPAALPGFGGLLPLWFPMPTAWAPFEHVCTVTLFEFAGRGLMCVVKLE